MSPYALKGLILIKIVIKSLQFQLKQSQAHFILPSRVELRKS